MAVTKLWTKTQKHKKAIMTPPPWGRVQCNGKVRSMMLVTKGTAVQVHEINNLLRWELFSTVYAGPLACWHWRPVVPKLWTK